MKKWLTILFLYLFSCSVHAQAWFFLSASENGKVEAYGDALSLDQEKHKGWVKVIDANEKDAEKLLILADADCKRKKIRSHSTILYFKDGRHFFMPKTGEDYQEIDSKDQTQPIFDWLCEGKYNQLIHMIAPMGKTASANKQNE